MINILIVISAKYLFLVSIAISVFYLCYLWIKEKSKLFFLLKLSIVSFTLSYILAKLSGHFISDPRPFVVEHVKPLIAHAADNGFPSDHMLLTMTIASVVFIHNRKLGVLLIIISLCVGIARVLAKVHHIEDIVGSMIIATGVTYLTFAVGKLYKTKRFSH